MSADLRIKRDRFDRRATMESGVANGPIGGSLYEAFRWVVGRRVPIPGTGGNWRQACAALRDWRKRRAEELRAAEEVRP